MQIHIELVIISFIIGIGMIFVASWLDSKNIEEWKSKFHGKNETIEDEFDD